MDDDQRERMEREKTLCADYSLAFEGKEGRSVLEDLKNFCGAESLCFDESSRRTAFMLGARSVWLYIQERMSGKALLRMNLLDDRDVTMKSHVSP